MRFVSALVVGCFVSAVTASRLRDDDSQVLADVQGHKVQDTQGQQRTTRLLLSSRSATVEDEADALEENRFDPDDPDDGGGWSKSKRREMFGSPMNGDEGLDDAPVKPDSDNGDERREHRKPQRVQRVSHRRESRSPHDGDEEEDAGIGGASLREEGAQDGHERGHDTHRDYGGDYDYGKDDKKPGFAEQYEGHWTYRDHGRHEKDHHDPGEDGSGGRASLFSSDSGDEETGRNEHKQQHKQRRKHSRSFDAEDYSAHGPDHDGDHHGDYDNPGHHHPSDEAEGRYEVHKV